jgi:hypothetical protein
MFFWSGWPNICDSGVLHSLTIIVLGPVCGFNSSSVCLMKLDALTFSTYMLIIFPLNRMFLYE